MLPQNSDGGQTSNDGGQNSDESADSHVADVATTTVLKNGLWFGYVVKSLSLFLAHGGRSVPQNHDDHDGDVEAQLLEQEITTDGHVIDTTQISTDKDKLVRIVKEKDLNGLRRLGGVDRAMSLQKSHFENSDGGQNSNDCADSHVADVATTTVLKNGLWFGYVVKSLSLFLAHGGRSVPPNHDDHDGDVEAPLLEQEITTDGHVIDTTQISTDKDKLVRIVKEKDLNGLRRLGGVDRAMSLQKSHFEGNEDDGIGDQDPQEYYWERIQGKGFLFFFIQAINTYTIFLLFISAILLFSIEIIEEGPKEGWHDGVAVAFGIFLLVSFPSLLNFLRERKAIKMMLKEKKGMKRVTVERNGNLLNVFFYQVRVWDTVHLEKGDRIPADGLLTSVERLRVDEVNGSEIDRDGNPFLVSGSEIDRDGNPFLVSGSKVKEGRGSMIVVVSDFGSNDRASDDNLHEAREGELFYALMQKPYEYIEKLALFMSVIIALIVLIRVLLKTRDGYYKGLPEMKGQVTMKTMVQMLESIILKPRGRVSTLVSALVTLVVGVQHGMPLVVRFCLRYWRAKLSYGQVTLQNISSCCTLGLVTTVVVDGGNGDLLHKKPEVKKFFMGERDVIAKEFEPLASDQFEVLNSIFRRWICWDNVPEISTRDHKVTVSWEKNSKWGATMTEEKSQVVEYRRSSSSGKNGCEVLMRKIGEDEQSLHLHWKGPPLAILDMCSHFYDPCGKILALADDLKSVTFKKLIEDMETEGLIPIAFAHRQTNVEKLEKEGLILLAIIGLKYECRSDVKALVNDFRKAGVVDIILASKGDPQVVKSISQELKPPSSSNETVIEVDQGVGDSVESSTTTTDKFRTIEKLQEKGDVVAFVGGSSITDISVLQKADLVITHETRSVEIAKMHSDIFLLKNYRPYSLAPIRRCGKCVYRNIQKFFQLQLTFWISGLSVILVSTMHSGESPLSSVQMIWVSLIVSLLCGLMMVMELNDYDDQSSKRNQLLVTQETWTSIAIQVVCQVCLLLIIHFLIGTKYASTKTKRDILNTIIFNTFTLCQIFNLLNSMNLAKKEVLGIVLSNLWFLVALVSALCIQVLVVQFGLDFFNCEKLNVNQWALCFLLAAFLLIVDSFIHSFISQFSLESFLSF